MCFGVNFALIAAALLEKYKTEVLRNRRGIGNDLHTQIYISNHVKNGK